MAEAGWPLPRFAHSRRRSRPDGGVAGRRDVLFRLRCRDQPQARPRGRLRARGRRARLDARARGRRRVSLGAGDEAEVRRADATRLYYVLQVLLSMPTWVVMAVYLVRELN